MAAEGMTAIASAYGAAACLVIAVTAFWCFVAVRAMGERE